MSIVEECMAKMKELQTQNREPCLPKRVLIVDDNVMDVELLRAELIKMGLQVDVSVRPDDAVFKVRQAQPYSMVFLDLAFPGQGTGAEALHCIRRMNPTQPITIITGSVSPELEQAASALVNCYVLKKPADLPALRRVMDKAPDHKQS